MHLRPSSTCKENNSENPKNHNSLLKILTNLLTAYLSIKQNSRILKYCSHLLLYVSTTVDICVWCLVVAEYLHSDIITYPVWWAEVDSLSTVIALVKPCMIASWERHYKLPCLLVCLVQLEQQIITIKTSGYITHVVHSAGVKNITSFPILYKTQITIFIWFIYMKPLRKFITFFVKMIIHWNPSGSTLHGRSSNIWVPLLRQILKLTYSNALLHE